MAEGSLNRAIILGVAGDPGGSRVLLPVFDYLFKSGTPFEIFDHGYLGTESPSHWKKIPVLSGSPESGAAILAERNVRSLVFASSIKDDFPLQMARRAIERNIPAVHVLDHWTNYLNRLKTDGQPTVFPDIYTVMDQRAYDQAVAEGIPASTLRIVGQPSFSSLLDENRIHMKKSVSQNHYGDAGNKKRFILFVSEPVSADQGDSPSTPHYRGYTEKQVLTILCSLLQTFASKVRLGILPHPREKAEELGMIFNAERGKLEGEMIDRPNGRTALYLAEGVIGMASILLYEAWLLGKPVISLQPGFRKKELAFMKDREGCLFLDGSGDMNTQMSQWIDALGSSHGKRLLRDDLHVHAQAAEKICKIILGL